MTKFTELQTIVLDHDIQSHGLIKGDMGAVVNVYTGGKKADVEFVTATGKTAALVTLSVSDVRDVAPNDLLHVRGLASA